jgi:hypothetical protein
MKKALVFSSALVALCLAGPSAFSSDDINGDIVWRTYTVVENPADVSLNCVQLQTEIDRVDSDIVTMKKTMGLLDRMMKNAVDLQNSQGYKNRNGRFLTTQSESGQESIPKIRKQVSDSYGVAKARRRHLTDIQPVCKAPPPMPPQPAP